MIKVELTEEEHKNLLIFMDRVDMRGITEASAMMQIMKRLQRMPVPLRRDEEGMKQANNNTHGTNNNNNK